MSVQRVPPHSLEAEESLVGSMLLSSWAVEAVLPFVLGEDFYKPAHGHIFEAILALTREGRAVDLVTVADELRRAELLASIGGKGELARLHAQTPASANALQYARIVIEAASKRRLIAAAGAIGELGYDASVPSADAVARAQELVANADIPVGGSPDLSVQEFCMEEHEYDWAWPGILERGDRWLLVAKEGYGKALALDTLVPTTRGWMTMGELAAGDEVFGPDGQPTAIVSATAPMADHPCYRVRFSDGASIVADAEHLWRTDDYLARNNRAAPGQLRTTEQIACGLRVRNGHTANHSIDCAAPLAFPERELPIDPYVLGAWLGDGHSAAARVTTADEEIVDAIRAAGWTVARVTGAPYSWSIRGPQPRRGSFLNALRQVGVLGDKHIPETYLTGSIDQRLALLQGLMDTDGTISLGATGARACEFSVTNKRLAHDTWQLIQSLGIKATLLESPARLYGRFISTRYRLGFQTDLPIFRLRRKAERAIPLRTLRARRRYIVAAEPVPSVPVRCITVAAADGMFVVGRECIATHNSTAERQVAVCLSQGIDPFRLNPIPRCCVMLVDLENPPPLVRRKLRQLLDNCSHSMERAYEPDRLRVLCRPEGIDLTSRSDELWLHERIMANRALWAQRGWEPDPFVLVIGPVYKLHDVEDEKSSHVRAVQRVLDRIRTRHGCALAMETHAPHESFAAKAPPRSLRPAGSRLWLRWPEFVLAIEATEDNAIGVAQVYHVRAPRDERAWPSRLRRGGRWPWQADEGTF